VRAPPAPAGGVWLGTGAVPGRPNPPGYWEGGTEESPKAFPPVDDGGLLIPERNPPPVLGAGLGEESSAKGSEELALGALEVGGGSPEAFELNGSIGALIPDEGAPDPNPNGSEEGVVAGALLIPIPENGSPELCTGVEGCPIPISPKGLLFPVVWVGVEISVNGSDEFAAGVLIPVNGSVDAGFGAFPNMESRPDELEAYSHSW